MKSFWVVLSGGLLFCFAAVADNCLDEGYSLIGSMEEDEVPLGYEDYDCESCLRNGIYYWKCKGPKSAEEDEAEEESGPKAEVNCMDYLRVDDVDGFAKCTGLPGKWERKGNQLLRVD